MSSSATNLPQTQKVFRLPSQTGYTSLTCTDEPLPILHPHEILVRIRAVSLNYRDLVVANGQYPFPVRSNVIPCSDASGTIISLGNQIASSGLDLQVGDRVIANFDPSNLYGAQRDWDHGHGGPIDGVLREYAAFPAVSVVKVEDGGKMSWAEMASLVCTGTTAWNALYGAVPLVPGQTVLFQGTGGISITGLLLAKAAGATTIITSSSDTKLDLVRSRYQPDHVINYTTTPDWSTAAKSLTPNNRGVDHIFENGGAGTIAQSVDAIRMGGTISVIGFLAKKPEGEEMPDVAGLALGKGCIVRGINVGSKALLEDLVRFVVARGLRMPVDRVFGFSEEGVREAYGYLESGRHVGKVCIEVGE